MDSMELVKEIINLSKKQPDNWMISDADTILTDLVDTMKEDVDLKVEGISNKLFNLYLRAENKDVFLELFYLTTKVDFADYLDQCKKKMEQNLQEAIQPRRIWLLKSFKIDENSSFCFITDAPKERIEQWLQFYMTTYIQKPDNHLKLFANGLIEAGYMVKLLYAPDDKFHFKRDMDHAEVYYLPLYEHYGYTEIDSQTEGTIADLYEAVFGINLYKNKEIRKNGRFLLDCVKSWISKLKIFDIDDSGFFMIIDDESCLAESDYAKVKDIAGSRGYDEYNIYEMDTVTEGKKKYISFRDYRF